MRFPMLPFMGLLWFLGAVIAVVGGAEWETAIVFLGFSQFWFGLDWLSEALKK